MEKRDFDIILDPTKNKVSSHMWPLFSDPLDKFY